jgi:hypothetical protein
MGDVLHIPVLNWGTRSRSRPWGMPRKHRTGRYRRLSQGKASLCLNLKWLLVLVLVDMVILRTYCVLPTHLEVLPRRTHLHLNAVFVFGVFIFGTHALQFIARLELVLIFASLIVRLHRVMGDCMQLISAPAVWLQHGLRLVLRLQLCSIKSPWSLLARPMSIWGCLTTPSLLSSGALAHSLSACMNHPSCCGRAVATLRVRSRVSSWLLLWYHLLTPFLCSKSKRTRWLSTLYPPKHILLML